MITGCLRRAILPGNAGQGASNGVWPAHWMMPNDNSCWPDHGEIDIMEMIDGDGTYHGTYHWNEAYPLQNCTSQNNQTSGQIGVPAWHTTFHEYAVEYFGGDGSHGPSVTFVVDGRVNFFISPARCCLPSICRFLPDCYSN